jgi:hypothetical protein
LILYTIIHKYTIVICFPMVFIDFHWFQWIPIDFNIFSLISDMQHIGHNKYSPHTQFL